jgi:hypothetical protein
MPHAFRTQVSFGDFDRTREISVEWSNGTSTGLNPDDFAEAPKRGNAASLELLTLESFAG